MRIIFQCECGATLRKHKDFAGKRIRCVVCRQSVSVPEAGSAESEPTLAQSNERVVPPARSMPPSGGKTNPPGRGRFGSRWRKPPLSRKDLLHELARGQKSLILAYFVSVIACFLPVLILLMVLPLTLSFLAGSAMKVCTALGFGSTKRLVFSFGVLIPVLGLPFLVLLSFKSSQALKREGVRVGMMGANDADLVVACR